MKSFSTFFMGGLLICSSFSLNARPKNYLKKCWQKQCGSLKEKYLFFAYREQLNEFYHSAEPWQQLSYTGKGTVWCNAGNFLRQDSLINGRRTLYSKTQLSKAALLLLDYGSKNQSELTKNMVTNQTLLTARYTPVILVNYFLDQNVAPAKESTSDTAVYKTIMDKTVVTLFIRTADRLAVKITTLENDDLRGDILSSYSYRDYASEAKTRYPKNIQIEKMNGRLKDEVYVDSIHIVAAAPELLEKPAEYKLKENVVLRQDIKTRQYSPAIYFIDLLHTGSTVMVVEFKDFLLVSEAPLNSQNGELIISEAGRIAPGKPIKYFTFSHHHPDYLGGIRPFIHKRAIVLATKEDKEYLKYLASSPHTLIPDSLQLQPRLLALQETGDSLTITDGQYEMKIYFIGMKSGHTKDYLVYYFPEEKLLVEGDLIWIKKEGSVQKARENQAGLYHAVKELGLDVKNMIQTWSGQSGQYKIEIPFADLEQSVSIK